MVLGPTSDGRARCFPSTVSAMPRTISSTARADLPEEHDVKPKKWRGRDRPSNKAAASDVPHRARVPLQRLGVTAPAVTRRRRGTLGPVGKAVAKFTAAGLATAVVVAVVAVYLARDAATEEAVNDARSFVETIGEWLVEPALDDGVFSATPAALRSLDEVVAEGFDRGQVVRVKLWSQEGRILYSDDPRLIGAVYSLDDDKIDVLRNGGTAAEVSDLSEAENRFEREHGKLLEVYHRLATPGGEPVLLEVYLPYDDVTALSRRVWLSFLPAVVGGLLLLYIIQIPLAVQMARRLSEGERQRGVLARRAADATEAERRRIAADLHDGVVQGLAGMSYSLAAAADRIERAGLGDVADTMRQMGSDLRRWVRELRSLLVSIAPPKLHEAGLGPALSDLAAGVVGRDIDVTTHVEPGLRLDPDTEALVFRTAQEALRNAVTHAHASQITIALEQYDGRARLEVTDDGVGFTADGRDAPMARGHVGLELLAALAEDAGGRLRVESAPGRGTQLCLEIPA